MKTRVPLTRSVLRLVVPGVAVVLLLMDSTFLQAVAAGLLAGCAWILLAGFLTGMEPRASRRLAAIDAIVFGVLFALSILIRARAGIGALAAQTACLMEWTFCVFQEQDSEAARRGGGLRPGKSRTPELPVKPWLVGDDGSSMGARGLAARPSDGTRAAKMIGVFLLALLMASCSYYQDAVVFNPCSEEATVSFSSSATTPDEPSDWNEPTLVRAESTRTVKSVFSDANGDGRGWALISFAGQEDLVVETTIPSEGPVPVGITAEQCPSP